MFVISGLSKTVLPILLVAAAAWSFSSVAKIGNNLGQVTSGHQAQFAQIDE